MVSDPNFQCDILFELHNSCWFQFGFDGCGSIPVFSKLTLHQLKHSVFSILPFNYAHQECLRANVCVVHLYFLEFVRDYDFVLCSSLVKPFVRTSGICDALCEVCSI